MRPTNKQSHLKYRRLYLIDGTRVDDCGFLDALNFISLLFFQPKILGMAAFNSSTRRELVFDRGPKECRTLQNILQRRNSQGGAVFWMKLDRERKLKQQINEQIQNEVKNMMYISQEPIEIKTKRQIHLELSSLRSMSRSSSSDISDIQFDDETQALLLLAKKRESEQAEKREFELAYVPGNVFKNHYNRHSNKNLLISII